MVEWRGHVSFHMTYPITLSLNIDKKKKCLNDPWPVYLCLENPLSCVHQRQNETCMLASLVIYETISLRLIA